MPCPTTQLIFHTFSISLEMTNLISLRSRKHAVGISDQLNGAEAHSTCTVCIFLDCKQETWDEGLLNMYIVVAAESAIS